MTTSLLTVREVILTRMSASWTRWTVYDHDVPDKPPADATGRVHPYAVLYLAPTWRDTTTESLCAADGVESISWQVTVAAGHPMMALRAVEQADAALLGFTLGLAAGPVRRDPTVPLRADRDVKPARWYVPLIYRADLG